MKNILKFEFDKLFRQRSFYICSFITMALLIINILSTNIQMKDAEEINVFGWSYAAKAAGISSFQMIAGIFTVLFVCDEFEQNTLKNIYSKGYGRGSVYIGKYISSLFAMLIIFTANTALAFVLSSVLWETGSIGKYPFLILCQLAVLIAYHALIYAISIILEKTGSSIAFSILGPMIIVLIFGFADKFFKLKDFKFADHWLDSLMTKSADIGSSVGELSAVLVFALIYTFVFFIVGFTANKRKQL